MSQSVAERTYSPEELGFRSGATAGVLLMLGSSAVHWLITPASHPDASTAMHVANLAQLTVGFGGAIFLTLRQVRRTKTSLRVD